MFYLCTAQKRGEVIRQRGRLSYIADEGRGVRAYYNDGKNRVSDPDPHGCALICVAGSGSGSRCIKCT
jgi:hypothetical protein